jgi:hypothetical protein
MTRRAILGRGRAREKAKTTNPIHVRCMANAGEMDERNLVLYAVIVAPGLYMMYATRANHVEIITNRECIDRTCDCLAR